MRLLPPAGAPGPGAPVPPWLVVLRRVLGHVGPMVVSMARCLRHAGLEALNVEAWLAVWMCTDVWVYMYRKHVFMYA